MVEIKPPKSKKPRKHSDDGGGGTEDGGESEDPQKSAGETKPSRKAQKQLPSDLEDPKNLSDKAQKEVQTDEADLEAVPNFPPKAQKKLQGALAQQGERTKSPKKTPLEPEEAPSTLEDQGLPLKKAPKRLSPKRAQKQPLASIPNRPKLPKNARKQLQPSLESRPRPLKKAAKEPQPPLEDLEDLPNPTTQQQKRFPKKAVSPRPKKPVRRPAVKAKSIMQ